MLPHHRGRTTYDVAPWDLPLLTLAIKRWATCAGGDTPQPITAPKIRNGTRFITVVPSDTAALGVVPTGLYALTAVNLHLKGSDGVASSAIPVAAGQTLPFAPTFVMATGTTATVVALV